MKFLSAVRASFWASLGVSPSLTLKYLTWKEVTLLSHTLAYLPWYDLQVTTTKLQSEFG